MLKLACGLSKKVGEPNYGSRGASVTVEMELDSVTLRQPERLKQHIRCAFDRVREAIEEELGRPGPAAGHVGGSESAPARRNGTNPDRPASSSQLRLLRVLADRRGEELADLVRDRCGKEDPAELTLKQASRLIDELGEGADVRERR